MNIPIVFTFDNNLVDPAIVCMTSLLENKNNETFYDIYILYIDLEEKNRNKIEKAFSQSSGYNITFLDVHSEFDFSDGFEIRGITTTAYLRLLVPRVLKHIPKIIYADVDLIFMQDLGELYERELTKKIGGVVCLVVANDLKYLQKVGLSNNYINSGVLVFNNSRIQDEDVEKSLSLINNRYTYQDQDIINISYAGEINSTVHLRYNFTPAAHELMLSNPERLFQMYSEEQVEDLFKAIAILHYTGPKPWRKKVALGGLWWEFYRKSSIADFRVYLIQQLLEKEIPPVIGLLKAIINKMFRGRKYWSY